MTEEKMRKEFEEWCKENAFSVSRKRDSNEYFAADTHWAWMAWQAASITPPGFVLVPVEPTQEMCMFGQEKAREWPTFPLRIVSIWKAMLEAAK